MCFSLILCSYFSWICWSRISTISSCFQTSLIFLFCSGVYMLYYCILLRCLIYSSLPALFECRDYSFSGVYISQMWYDERQLDMALCLSASFLCQSYRQLLQASGFCLYPYFILFMQSSLCLSFYASTLLYYWRYRDSSLFSCCLFSFSSCIFQLYAFTSSVFCLVFLYDSDFFSLTIISVYSLRMSDTRSLSFFLYFIVYWCFSTIAARFCFRAYLLIIFFSYYLLSIISSSIFSCCCFCLRISASIIFSLMPLPLVLAMCSSSCFLQQNFRRASSSLSCFSCCQSFCACSLRRRVHQSCMIAKQVIKWQWTYKFISILLAVDPGLI